jgi:hypothetical protein
MLRTENPKEKELAVTKNPATGHFSLTLEQNFVVARQFWLQTDRIPTNLAPKPTECQQIRYSP